MLSAEPFSPIRQEESIDPAGCADEADDELSSAFPGCSFIHVLTVITQDRIRTTMTVLSLLDAFGAQLTSLRVTKIDGRFEHRVRVNGLRPHEARNLSRRLSFLPSVDYASVEHQILKAA